MRPLLLLAMAGFLASCAGKPRLEVKQFVLRDTGGGYKDDPMIQGEKQRLLYGAIGVREQSQRLGQYYTILWNDASGSGPVEVLFEYQQGGSGSKIKRITRAFPAGTTSGKAEFSNIGDNYSKAGRILAWKVSLLRDGRPIDSKRSYLWQ